MPTLGDSDLNSVVELWSLSRYSRYSGRRIVLMPTPPENSSMTRISIRCRLLNALLAPVLLAAVSPQLHARELDLSKPEDGVLASHRIACGTQKEGHFEYGVWIEGSTADRNRLETAAKYENPGSP